MPINIPNSLPANSQLRRENIFVMNEERASHQDIRPLKIAILNLMPKKIETETQLLRVLSNSPLQVDIELLQTETHVSRNTSEEHLLKFYKTIGEVENDYFDGMIITGAPVEQMPFEEVDYWPELCYIFEWSKSHVYSTFHICWGAQAGLYYHYGVPKYDLPQKMFGIFPHHVLLPYHPLVRGFDETFYVPHSRHTECRKEDILATGKLEVLTESPVSGVHIAASLDGRQFSSPATANTTGGHWRRSISATWIKGCRSISPTTISTATTRKTSRSSSGGPTPTSSMSTGSTISSTSRRLTIYRRCGMRKI